MLKVSNASLQLSQHPPSWPLLFYSKSPQYSNNQIKTNYYQKHIRHLHHEDEHTNADSGTSIKEQNQEKLGLL